MKKKFSKHLVYIATLINPVDHRLYAFVWHTSDTKGYVITPTSGEDIEVWGEGYFSETDAPAPETDCPRSHTPQGVSGKGRGLGLMLYSGLALAAGYGSVAARAQGMPNMSPCISSSNEQRSDSATKWWSEQVERGFATEKEYDEDAECENKRERVEVDVSDAGIDSDYIEREFETEGGTVSNVEGTLSGRVEYEFCPIGVGSAQMLAARSVFKAGLVFHYNDLLHAFASKAKTLDAATLLELDVTPLKNEHQLLRYVLTELEEHGASQSQIDRFIKDNELDVQEIVKTKADDPLYPDYSRNPRKHSAAWRRRFKAHVNG